jgi:hypothetical protein
MDSAARVLAEKRRISFALDGIFLVSFESNGQKIWGKSAWRLQSMPITSTRVDSERPEVALRSEAVPIVAPKPDRFLGPKCHGWNISQ